jgi:hypothetical protein
MKQAVFYVNIGNLPPSEVSAYIEKIKQQISNAPIMLADPIFIPVKERETEVVVLDLD